MRRFLTLGRAPIFAVAGFIAFLFLSTLWNFAVENTYPKLRIRSAHPLTGVSKPRPAPVSLDAFLAGETQKAFSHNLARSQPVFPFSVRVKSQWLYSAFGAAGAAGVLVGKERQLFERIYTDEFCQRGGAQDRAAIETWAARIHEIEDVAASLGKGFVYLISPSKAAQYSQYLPDWLPCPALSNADADKLSPYREALDARGVSYVDAPAIFSARENAYPIELFPRGGTHWNLLGAALAVRDMTKRLKEHDARTRLGLFDFAWSATREPQGTDRDLLDLLNLLWPDDDYPVARIERVGGGEDCARPPRITALGGSFVREAIVVLSKAACPPEIDYWFYMRTQAGDFELVRFRTAPGDVDNGEQLPGSLAELRESVSRADVLLLEENESNIATTRQLANLSLALRGPPLSQNVEK